MDKQPKILGTYEGKSCDADVVNNNGMYLSRELFDNLVNSDEYKTAIKNKYYIGFLGHPEDPNCMDFRNACIVMTTMHMDNNGDIIASFDLVNTPVGQVVKAFIDVGVKFGISIRGAGDVAPDGTVDPDTFVFRGFDLVTFPAYDDCVPEFTAIAASTDIESQKKYRKVCNVVKRNLQAINSCEAIEVIQDQFNKNSDEYKMLENRVKELQVDDEDKDLYIEVLEQKIKGLTLAYMDKVRECNEHKQEVHSIHGEMDEYKNDLRKMKRIAQITSSQSVEASKTIDSLRSSNKSLKSKIAAAKKLDKISSSQYSNLQGINASLRKKNQSLIQSSNELQKELESVKRQKDTIVKNNLLSDKKVEANESLIKSKDESIRSLQASLRETVAENERLKEEVSNCEADVDSLNSRVEACEQIIFDYQQAYANSCAYAAGIHLDNIPITSSTTVDELKSYIYDRAASGIDSRFDSYHSDSELNSDNQEDEYEGNEPGGLIAL